MSERQLVDSCLKNDTDLEIPPLLPVMRRQIRSTTDVRVQKQEYQILCASPP